jgi:hypothetical protein
MDEVLAVRMAGPQRSPVRRSTGSRSRAAGLARSVECRQYPSPPLVSVPVIRLHQRRGPVPRLVGLGVVEPEQGGQQPRQRRAVGFGLAAVQHSAGQAGLDPEHQPGQLADDVEPGVGYPRARSRASTASSSRR